MCEVVEAHSQFLGQRDGAVLRRRGLSDLDQTVVDLADPGARLRRVNGSLRVQ